MTPGSVQRLYERHAFAVFRRCRQLLRDDEEARDAMQQTFLTVVEDPARFQGRSSPSTFLFGVATHHCLNRLRNRAARGAAWLDGLARSLEADRPVADQVEARQLAGAILAEADEETAAMAVYHFVDGLPQGEVAALVGRSRITVNQRLQRFKEQARLKGAP